MAKKAKVKRKSKRTARESQFIQEYLIDLNGSAAIKRAGYKGKYAAQAAFELLRKPYVIAEINAAMQKRAKKLELTGEFTLSRLKDLASSNIKNVAEWAEGSLILKDSAAITSEEAYGIESIQVKQTLRGPELKVKMRQPSVALELLGRHQGLFEGGEKGDPEADLADAIQQLEKEEGKKP